MNYFGLFFSFTLPGVILGILIAAAAAESARKRSRVKSRQKPQRGLYIENIKEEVRHEV
jgi:hypothetical protein